MNKNDQLEKEVREELKKINRKLNDSLQQKPEWELDQPTKKKRGRKPRKELEG